MALFLIVVITFAAVGGFGTDMQDAYNVCQEADAMLVEDYQCYSTLAAAKRTVARHVAAAREAEVHLRESMEDLERQRKVLEEWVQ